MKIAFLGDIAFIGNKNLNNNINIYDYFKDVSILLSECDYVIGNLETPFSKEKKSYGVKSAHIEADPENIQLLSYLNVNIVNLANNHIYDYGNEGYDLTKKLLEKSGIDYFGIEEKELILSDKNTNTNISLLGYCCYSTNPLGEYNNKSGKGINIFNPRVIEQKMVDNKTKGCLNILSLHMGEEHIHYPNYDHVRVVHKLQQKLDFIMIGHHPHVIQGMEEIGESFFAYSLGNFCFDDVYTEKSKNPLIKQVQKNKESVIVILDIQNNSITSKKIIPIFDNGERIVINNKEILLKLEEYNNLLKIDEDTFRVKRNIAWNEHVNSRKQQRDINWYIKRLNYKSVKMIMQAKRNRNKYNEVIKKYIVDMESKCEI